MEKNQLYKYCEKVNIKNITCDNCPDELKCWCEKGEYIETNKITIGEMLNVIQKFKEKRMTNP